MKYKDGPGWKKADRKRAGGRQWSRRQSISLPTESSKQGSTKGGAFEIDERAHGLGRYQKGGVMLGKLIGFSG